MATVISDEEYDAAIEKIKGDKTSKDRAVWKQINRRETVCRIDGYRIGLIDEAVQGRRFYVFICGKPLCTHDGHYMPYKDEEKAKLSLIRNFYKKSKRFK